MQIEAAVARKEFAPLIETLDLEEPRHNEVQVRVVASGVCHTDMAIRDQTIVPMPRPIVLGHEGAGIVEKVGASVTKVNVGVSRYSLIGVASVVPDRQRSLRPI